MPIKVDLVVLNAHILTLDSEHPEAEALAAASGRLLAVGSREEVAPLAKQARRVVNLHGQTVMPGFIDSHAHLADQGFHLTGLDLSGASSLEEVLQLVRSRVARAKPGETIIGYGWDESRWPQKRPPTKDDLDPVSPHNPLVLVRVCGHLHSLNSLALNQLPLDPGHPSVDRDPNTGQPTGILRDPPVDPRSLQPQSDAEQAILEACRYANSLGITSVHENLYQRQLPLLGTYLTLRRAGKLTVRVYCNLEASLLDRVKALGLQTGLGDEYFKLGGIKIFLDGSLGARTAALTQPYADDPENRGLLVTGEEEYLRLLKRCNELGLQSCTHVIGDAAIAAALRCHQKAGGDRHIGRLRHALIHVEMLFPTLLPQARRLGLLMLMQPNFVYQWGQPGGMYEDRLGPERAWQMNNFRLLLDAKLGVAFGSDCMPMGPLLGIHAAVNHPNPEARLTIEEALHCYTLESAYASFEEQDKGTLTPGKLADFIVLSQNPLITPPKDLRKIRVLQTYVGGRLVYSSL